MPYINKLRRLNYEDTPLDELYMNNPGELNYLITRICASYWSANNGYQGINDIVGALEGAKLEFYRRVAVPYEDTKIIENGDVYVAN